MTTTCTVSTFIHNGCTKSVTDSSTEIHMQRSTSRPGFRCRPSRTACQPAPHDKELTGPSVQSTPALAGCLGTLHSLTAGSSAIGSSRSPRKPDAVQNIMYLPYPDHPPGAEFPRLVVVVATLSCEPIGSAEHVYLCGPNYEVACSEGAADSEMMQNSMCCKVPTTWNCSCRIRSCRRRCRTGHPGTCQNVRTRASPHVNG